MSPPLNPIGDIATPGLNENLPIETVTWETTSDWDNAVSEEAMEHPSGTVQQTPTEDGFEDLTSSDSVPSGWNPATGKSIDDSTTTPFGSVSLYSNTDVSGAALEATGLSHAPSQITFAYRETSTQGGHQYYIENGSGQVICHFGTGNPEVGVESGSGAYCLESLPNPDYGAFRRFTVTFDWPNDQFDILWEDIEGSTGDRSRAGLSFLNSSSEIGYVAVGNNSLRASDFCSANPGNWSDGWVDELYGVPVSGTLTTATKSFTGPTQPDLQNLAYSLNTGNISLDIIGSPGTGSEEIVTQSLDGATSYTLTWSASHEDFRVKLNHESPDRELANIPTLSRVELQGEV